MSSVNIVESESWKKLTGKEKRAVLVALFVVNSVAVSANNGNEGARKVLKMFIKLAIIASKKN